VKAGGWNFGQVVLTPDQAAIPAAHLPVAVYPKGSNLPQRLRLDDRDGTGSRAITIRAGLPVTRLSKRVSGLAPALVSTGWIYQGKTNTYSISVPAGARRLVGEILESGAPDLDLYLYRLDATGGKELVCQSAGPTSLEYCNLDQPAAGSYVLEIDGYTGGDPSGIRPDSLTMATGVVGGGKPNNLSLASSRSKTAIGGALDLTLRWKVGQDATVWYGDFSLGSDAADPASLGHTNVDLYLQ
jgi:hypothetical protein